MTNRNPIYRVYRFYADGFRAMTLGRTLWAVVLLKLLIMFGILKLFFRIASAGTSPVMGNRVADQYGVHIERVRKRAAKGRLRDRTNAGF